MCEGEDEGECVYILMRYTEVTQLGEGVGVYLVLESAYGNTCWLKPKVTTQSYVLKIRGILRISLIQSLSDICTSTVIAGNHEEVVQTHVQLKAYETIIASPKVI